MTSQPWGGSKVGRLRQQVVDAYGLQCWLCHQPITDETPTIDHVTPRSAGGSDELANLRPAHARCNSSRGDRMGGTLGSLAWMPAPHE